MKLPLTLRLAYHGFRSAVRAGLLFLIAWVVFIPANANERAALGVSQATQYPPGLRTMRTARIVVAIAPDRAYTAIASVMGSDVSPLLVRLAMIQMAAGNVLPAASAPAPQVESSRNIDGPRFIEVD